jgi:hypothetical protein
MFLTPQEVNIIKADFKNLLLAYEATTIVLKFRTWESSSGNVHPIYKYMDGNIDPVEKIASISAIQKIIKEEDLDILAFGIVQVGDSIFFVHPDIDFNIPDGENQAVPDTLKIVDTSGIEWIPRLKKSEQLSNHLMTHIGDDQYAQAIPASIRRNIKP